MTARLYELIKVFNTLQSSEERVAFQAQWKAFLSNLHATDQRFAMESLQQAILSNLAEYRKEVSALVENKNIPETENLLVLSIPPELSGKIQPATR